MKIKSGIATWIIISLLNLTHLYAQGSLPETPIELSHSKGTIKAFLEEITAKTGITFTYLNNQMPLEKTIVMENRQISLKVLLDKIAEESGLTYIVKNTKVFFIEKEDSNLYTVSGTVRDKASGETLIGATVYIQELRAGITSNAYGFYSLTIPSGKYTIESSYLGYETYRDTLQFRRNLKLDIELNPATTTLNEVVVSSKRRDENVGSTETGSHEIAIKSVKNMPALGGEPDVLKTLQMLPGVTTIGEGSTGIFIRGGGVDQNLILLDEAPVYNPSHFLGFMSVFNPDALKDIKLYKGDIPAKYGGRASSVLDIRMKEGDKKRFRASGGTGLMGGARFTIENPIVKARGSFILSGRRTFVDPILWLVAKAEPQAKGTKLYFYDFNAKANYSIDSRNTVFLSGYFGRDVNKIPIIGSNISWGNTTGTLRWNHLFSQRLFSNATLIYSKYNYNLNAPATEGLFNWNSKIRDVNIKGDFTWYTNPSTTMEFGVNSIFHRIDPGSNTTTNMANNVPRQNALEHALYFSGEKKLRHNLTIEAGLRYSLFQNIGAATVYKFNEQYQPFDTIQHKAGKVYNSYGGFEPRLGINYRFNDEHALKASYNINRQYLHMLANSSLSFTSFDIWYPAGPNVKPLIARQLSLGYFRNFRNNAFEASVEGYYKDIKNQPDFRDHASLLFNPFLEGEIRIGKAYAYGIETFLRKKEGKFTGWAGYTYSRSVRKIEAINEGKEYPSLYDQPHKIVLTSSYEVSPRINISANWIYNTGTPITLPKESFLYENQVVPVYSERNAFRLPDYHRLDLSLTLRKKKNTTKRTDSRWILSVYNAYARKNPLSYYIGEDLNSVGPGPFKIIATQLYLFSFTPSLSYIFTF